MGIPYAVETVVSPMQQPASPVLPSATRRRKRAPHRGAGESDVITVPASSTSSRRELAGGFAGVRGWPSLSGGRAARASLATAMFHLGALLKAGVPLADSLDELARLESNAFMSRIWREVFKDVRAGMTLREACARHPDIFDATMLATIHAGERGDSLQVAVNELESSLAWQQDIVRRLKTVLIYPVFTLVVLTGAMVFLLGSVVPSMVGFLDLNGEPLRWHTRALMSVSNGIQSYAPALFSMVVILIIVAVILVYRSRRLRVQFDGLCLLVPVWGRLQSQFASARFARAVAQLYGAGVALPEAWRLGEALVANRALRRALTSVRVAMLDGSSLGDALHERSLIPRVLQRLCAVGESAGALEQALRQAAEQLQVTARNSLERVERLLGPGLLCVVGALLAWIVLSVLVPLYDVVFMVDLP